MTGHLAFIYHSGSNSTVFTTICTLNPNLSSKEEGGRITDLFDGIIEIYEKETDGRLKRFLAIRKMYGLDYSESELILERSKLV